MISSEAQRTLVKSPPELWTELSDPVALARHLGDFGEIRITRSEPELLVEWEGDRARGQVLLKPSGWGTKVTLTVTGELAGEDPEPPSDTPDEPTFDPSLPAETPLATELPASEPQAERDPAPSPEEKPAAALEPAPPAPGTDPFEDHPEPEREAPEQLQSEQAPEATVPEKPAAKRGFFARLFGRGAETGEAQPPDEARVPLGAASTFAGSEPEPPDDAGGLDGAIETTGAAAAIEPVEAREEPDQHEMTASTGVSEPSAAGLVTTAAGTQEAMAQAPAGLSAELGTTAGGIGGGTQEAPAQAPAGLSAELRSAEEAAAEQVNLVLTSVLDRLGSAHHRPFSRS
jgi:hypothetical protein